MKNKILLFILLTALFLGGFYYLHFLRPPDESSNKKQGAQLELPVFLVSRSDVVQSKEFNARITASKTSEIRPQVNGVIKKRLFNEGAFVQEGDQLYLIDPKPYDLALDNAKAQLQKAHASRKALKAKINRYQQLMKLQAISKQEYDNALAESDQSLADIEIAKAAVKTAELNLEYTKVYAPISGQIGFSNVTEGALVTANQTDALATITQVDPVYADFTAQPADIVGLEKQKDMPDKTTIKIFLNDLDKDYPQEGTFEFGDARIDEATGTVKGRISFPNPDRVLRPGQFVKIVIFSSPQSAFLVPQNMTARDSNARLYVWVIGPDGKAIQKAIRAKDTYDTGDSSHGPYWIVREGLNEGDQIIASGFQKIKIGDIVKPAPVSIEDPKQSFPPK